MKKRFCFCACYYTHNIFLKEYEIHVEYINKNQFLKDYSQALLTRNCTNPEQLIPQLEAESLRRKTQHKDSLNRRLQVLQRYTPRHPHLYALQPSFLDERFLDIVQVAREAGQTAEGLMEHIKSHQERIYSFPVFTKEFCKLFLEELTNYEEFPLTKGRPNTMNKYGIRLDELGFDNFISSLRTEYLTPLTRILFPDWGGDALDSHKSFVVTYKEGEDVDLSYHFDNAEVTINISLNEDYDDGDLYFGPMKGEESSQRLGYSHQLGRGLLHRGQQFHGALPISQGIRHNLIIWMRSSQVRNDLCPMCDQQPVLVPVEEGHGDGFTQIEADVCSLS